jgi:hypothetical protein
LPYGENELGTYAIQMTEDAFIEYFTSETNELIIRTNAEPIQQESIKKEVFKLFGIVCEGEFEGVTSTRKETQEILEILVRECPNYLRVIAGSNGYYLIAAHRRETIQDDAYREEQKGWTELETEAKRVKEYFDLQRLRVLLNSL